MMSNQLLQNGPSAVEIVPPRGARRRAAAPVAAYCVWVNGELLPYEAEAAPRFKRHAERAPAVFEDIRCYATARGPAIFRLRDHLRRFFRAATAAGAGDLTYTIHDLQRAANVAVHANNLSAGALRAGVYTAGGEEPLVAVAAWGWPERAGARRREAGARALLAAAPPGQPPYAAATRARQAARRAQFDEALLFDEGDKLDHSSGGDLFLVREGTLYTPPRDAATAGVARDTLLTLARLLGKTVVEADLTRVELERAEELFLVSTAAEVVPLVALDGEPVGAGRPGPVTRALQARYADAVRGRGSHVPAWLEYVMMEPLY